MRFIINENLYIKILFAQALFITFLLLPFKSPVYYFNFFTNDYEFWRFVRFKLTVMVHY